MLTGVHVSHRTERAKVFKLAPLWRKIFVVLVEDVIVRRYKFPGLF